jgi:hypothetical protein
MQFLIIYFDGLYLKVPNLGVIGGKVALESFIWNLLTITKHLLSIVIQIMIKENSNSRTALYKVRYECEGEILETDLILVVKKHNKRAVKRILSTLNNQRYDTISRIKLHFRKDVEGFTPKEYNQNLQREKEARIALGQRRRIYSRFYLKNNPYRPKSRSNIHDIYSLI